MYFSSNELSLISGYLGFICITNRMEEIADDQNNVKQEEVQHIINSLNRISDDLNDIANMYGIKKLVNRCKLWHIRDKNDVKVVSAYLTTVRSSIESAFIELSWLINDMELPSILDDIKITCNKIAL